MFIKVPSGSKTSEKNVHLPSSGVTVLSPSVSGNRWNKHQNCITIRILLDICVVFSCIRRRKFFVFLLAMINLDDIGKGISI